MKPKQYSKPKTARPLIKKDYDISVEKKAQSFRDTCSTLPPLSVYSKDEREEAGDKWYFYSDM